MDNDNIFKFIMY